MDIINVAQPNPLLFLPLETERSSDQPSFIEQLLTRLRNYRQQLEVADRIRYLRSRGAIVKPGAIPVFIGNYLQRRRDEYPLVYVAKGARLEFQGNFVIQGGQSKSMLSVEKDAELTVGHDVSINVGVVIQATTQTVIENGVRFGPCVRALGNPLHPTFPGEDLRRGPMRFRDNSWMQTGCIVGSHSEGTVIGEDTIIAAGAVVNGICKDRSMYVGNPGRAVPIRAFEDGLKWSNDRRP